MTSVKDIEGVGEAFAKKLATVGINTVEELLKAGANAAGRKDLAEKTGIAAANILKWVNHADLFRINGVAGQYAELLEAAGVDTVVELARRRADNLVEAMSAANAKGARRLVQALPSMKSVQGWIDEAKSMARVVSY